MYSLIISSTIITCFYFYFLKDFIYLFLEGGERREEERKRNINVWLYLLHPLVETWPATQACAGLGIRWRTFASLSSAQPLSHTSQGTFKNKFYIRWHKLRGHSTYSVLPNCSQLHNQALVLEQEEGGAEAAKNASHILMTYFTHFQIDSKGGNPCKSSEKLWYTVTSVKLQCLWVLSDLRERLVGALVSLLSGRAEQEH